MSTHFMHVTNLFLQSTFLKLAGPQLVQVSQFIGIRFNLAKQIKVLMITRNVCF